jgi:hypothetical protein
MPIYESPGEEESAMYVYMKHSLLLFEHLIQAKKLEKCKPNCT